MSSHPFTCLPPSLCSFHYFGAQFCSLFVKGEGRVVCDFNIGPPPTHTCYSLNHVQLCDPMDCDLYPWDSPGKNTGVGGHCLLQGIFVSQGFNLGLLHCRQILYRLSHQGSPREAPGKVLVATHTYTHETPYGAVKVWMGVAVNWTI